MVEQKYLKGGKRAFEGQKYTKYNKINNNLENLRGARLLPGGVCAPDHSSCGPEKYKKCLITIKKVPTQNS